MKHRALRDENGRHIGYVDDQGRLWTTKGRESHPYRMDHRGGRHPNRAHWERLNAAEALYGKENA